MVLLNVKEVNGWLHSRWALTYNVGWEQICKAMLFSYDVYYSTGVLVNGEIVVESNKNGILNLKEGKMQQYKEYL